MPGFSVGPNQHTRELINTRKDVTQTRATRKTLVAYGDDDGDDDTVMLNVLRCRLTCEGQAETNA